ncbi:putative coiled-coil domain-containing protein 104 [Trypanosoma grayi]|uniref:putative coiled-coil domain-containing protein 104 n=1 Tax=Trypanosoma grayi TaxID=71804 RepID=UPI0004F4A797|nr:putative coiled-coil domain-containing protein 104 [Trypanosoma grayi]KEG11640.1 putative coiled-coil domain-containing protein 104 [Trypanosoma grayi]
MTDDSWITESIVQFTHSPLWRTPVNNFVDDNCWIFSDDGEMKVEETEIHIAFRKLIDDLLTSFVKDIGVTLERVIAAVHNSRRDVSPTQEAAEQFLKYVFYMDDFRCFHTMMVSRNIELDILASRALLQQQKHGEDADNANLDEAAIDEETALKLAIEASLQDDNIMQKRIELEDVQIQEALALSIAAEEERARRVATEVEKEATQSGGPTSEASKEKLKALEEEKVQNVQKLEARALEVRQETMLRRITATQEMPASLSGSPSLDNTPQRVSAPQSQSQPQQKVPAAVPPSASAPSNSAAPARVTAAKGFGFKALPSIQPSFKELEAKVAEKVAPATAKPPEQQPEANPTKAAPSLEEMEARAKYMREQREKILLRNKANREKELKDFAANGEKPNAKSNGLQDGEKKMTIDLARRLRDDIIREATK